MVEPLGEALLPHDSGCQGKKLQFVQILLHLCLVLLLGDDGHEYGRHDTIVNCLVHSASLPA